MYKVVVVGPGAVGKTACVTAFVKRKVQDIEMLTIGADIQSKTVEIDGNQLNVSFWDLAGQERFGVVRSMYYKGLQALILMVDLTRAGSLNVAEKYLLEEIQPVTVSEKHLQCVAVVGNKSDLKEAIQVTDDELIQLANLTEEKIGLRTMMLKSSAKNLHDVDKMFHSVLGCLVKSMS
ncbi:MAG: Rab family GTPase [Candidatus Thorarchaeota archaeon]